jgi:hypothetical protein
MEAHSQERKILAAGSNRSNSASADAVVSRLTLWINGEEREAAFARKGQVTERIMP